MSESEYSDAHLGLYHANVERAIRGKRGQEFLRELKAALESLPKKALISGFMEHDDMVCALGAVGKARGMNDLERFNDSGTYALSKSLGITQTLATVIIYQNDYCAKMMMPNVRYDAMLYWVERNIINGETEQES